MIIFRSCALNIYALQVYFCNDHGRAQGEWLIRAFCDVSSCSFFEQPCSLC